MTDQYMQMDATASCYDTTVDVHGISVITSKAWISARKRVYDIAADVYPELV